MAFTISTPRSKSCAFNSAMSERRIPHFNWSRLVLLWDVDDVFSALGELDSRDKKSIIPPRYFGSLVQGVVHGRQQFSLFIF